MIVSLPRQKGTSPATTFVPTVYTLTDHQIMERISDGGEVV